MHRALHCLKQRVVCLSSFHCVVHSRICIARAVVTSVGKMQPGKEQYWSVCFSAMLDGISLWDIARASTYLQLYCCRCWATVLRRHWRQVHFLTGHGYDAKHDSLFSWTAGADIVVDLIVYVFTVQNCFSYWCEKGIWHGALDWFLWCDLVYLSGDDFYCGPSPASQLFHEQPQHTASRYGRISCAVEEASPSTLESPALSSGGGHWLWIWLDM